MSEKNKNEIIKQDYNSLFNQIDSIKGDSNKSISDVEALLNNNLNIWIGTQEQYDALTPETKASDNTLFFIREGN